MGTRKYLLCSSTQNNDNFHSLITQPSPDGKSLEVKIIKVNTSVKPCEASNLLVPTNYEILDYSDEAYYELYDYVYNAALLYMIDPYVRFKLADTELYKMVYYHVGTYGSVTSKSEEIKYYSRNLVALDRDVLLYIYYLTKTGDFASHMDRFNAMLHTEIPYYTGKRNARLRLGISKNKEKVLKARMCPWLLKYDNKVFEDDVDFLLEMLKPLGSGGNVALKHILDIKAVNNNLTYHQIAKAAIVMNLEHSSLIRFNEALGYFASLTKSYESLKECGYKHAFKLSRVVPFLSSIDFEDANKAIKPAFNVEDAKIYPLMNSGSVRYANTISNAIPADYLNSALASGSMFYLIVRHGKHYLAEVKDGIVTNIKRDGRDALLNVSYVKEEKGE